MSNSTACCSYAIKMIPLQTCQAPSATSTGVSGLTEVHVIFSLFSSLQQAQPDS